MSNNKTKKSKKLNYLFSMKNVVFLLVSYLLCIFTSQKRLLFSFKYVSYKLYIVQNDNKSLVFSLLNV